MPRHDRPDSVRMSRKLLELNPPHPLSITSLATVAHHSTWPTVSWPGRGTSTVRICFGRDATSASQPPLGCHSRPRGPRPLRNYQLCVSCRLYVTFDTSVVVSRSLTWPCPLRRYLNVSLVTDSGTLCSSLLFGHRITDLPWHRFLNPARYEWPAGIAVSYDQ